MIHILELYDTPEQTTKRTHERKDESTQMLYINISRTTLNHSESDSLSIAAHTHTQSRNPWFHPCMHDTHTTLSETFAHNRWPRRTTRSTIFYPILFPYMYALHRPTSSTARQKWLCPYIPSAQTMVRVTYALKSPKHRTRSLVSSHADLYVSTRGQSSELLAPHEPIGREHCS